MPPPSRIGTKRLWANFTSHKYYLGVIPSFQKTPETVDVSYDDGDFKNHKYNRTNCIAEPSIPLQTQLEEGVKIICEGPRDGCFYSAEIVKKTKQYTFQVKFVDEGATEEEKASGECIRSLHQIRMLAPYPVRKGFRVWTRTEQDENAWEMATCTYTDKKDIWVRTDAGEMVLRELGSEDIVCDRTVAKESALTIGKQVIAHICDEDIKAYYQSGTIISTQYVNGKKQFKVSSDDYGTSWCQLHEIRIMDVLPDASRREKSIIDDAADLHEEIIKQAQQAAAEKDKAVWADLPFGGQSFNDSETLESESTSEVVDTSLFGESSDSESMGFGLFD